jgi:hypothetical protein
MTQTVTARSIITECAPSADIELPEEVTEGDTLRPKKVWRGGSEGKSLTRWFRESDEGWDLVADTPTYSVTLSDLSCMIRFVFTPIRRDGQRGSDVTVECGPVEPKSPVVRNVRIGQNDRGLIVATGDYSGGYEGFSYFVWRTIDGETIANAGKTVEREMPPDRFVGKTMDVLYVPVRDDGLAGQTVMSSNRIVVAGLPKVLSADILAKGGLLAAGSVVRCRAVVTGGAKPKYQWSRGDGIVWEIRSGENDAEYRMTDGDVGFKLLCTIIAVNARGWESAKFVSSTGAHVLPKEKRLEFEGDVEKVQTGRILATRLGPEALAKAKLVWQRGDGDKWATVRTDDTFIVTINDVGCRIKAVAANGAKTEPCAIIEVDSIVASCGRAQIRSKNFKFSGRNRLGGVVWGAVASESGLAMDNKHGGKKNAKWGSVIAMAVDGTADEMELWVDPATKFVLVPTIEQRLEATVGKENVRDLVVFVLNGLKK